MARISLEQQLEQLATLGIVPNKTFKIKDVLGDFTQEELEEDPYNSIIASLASLECCPTLWTYRVGSIQPQPGYGSVIEKLESMTNGALGLKKVRDNFKQIFKGDYEEVSSTLKRAWVEFDYNGTDVHWDFVYDADYTDFNVFGRFNELLAEHGSDLRVYWDEEDIFAVFDPAQYKRYKKLNALPFSIVKYEEKRHG